MAGRHRRVVVVDDEEGILRLCRRLLERAGFEVVTFHQPYEALDYFQEHEADVLVVDTRMPEMDGFALMEQARLLQPGLAVVIMSGFATVSMAIEAFNHGADGLLLKPFESGLDLVDSVWRAISHRQRQEEMLRLSALRPLLEVAEILFSEREPEALQQTIVARVIEMLPADVAGVYLQEGEPPQARLLAAEGEVPLDLPPFWQDAQTQAHGFCFAQGKCAPEEEAFLRRYGWHSVLVAFAPRGQHQYALLAARRHAPAFQRNADATALGILARLAAAALENARLYQDLQNSMEELERSQYALAKAEKMAAIGRLTASLAHEVNNPLQAVRNSLYLASHPQVEAARRDEYIRVARQEVERLSDLVHRMLNFYRPGNVARSQVHFHALVEHTLTLLRSQMEKYHVRVEVNVPASLPPVMGVEDQLRQVLLNLVLNALEAMPEGGELYITGEEVDGQVVLTVEDTGPGIAPEVRDRLFEPLVSTKAQGTGLGLAVSYNIVAAHGGVLDIDEPRHGGGAAFRITLPAAERPA